MHAQIPELVLFDLDGTLVDSAPGLAHALNCQRQQHGLEALPDAAIRPYASHGTTGLLKVGFGMDASHTAYAAYVQEYLSLYAQVFLHGAVLFDGMAEVLAQFHKQGIAWGVVTNKHRQFAQAIMQQLGLSDVVLICGDDGQAVKPSPQGLLMACDALSIAPQKSLYVGDAQRDIAAGQAANMLTVVALYGYLSEQDQPHAWGADYAIDQPSDLLNLIQGLQRA